jgi:hypothetical protein
MMLIGGDDGTDVGGTDAVGTDVVGTDVVAVELVDVTVVVGAEVEIANAVPCVGAGVANGDRDLNNSFEHMFAFSVGWW